jgi:ferritin
MINDKIIESFNRQINEELFSSYLYLSMSAYFEDIGLKGFSTWMKVQAQEEVAHGMKFYKFLLERGAKVKLEAIKAPQTSWESPLKAFEDALNHEVFITDCINKLVNLSFELKDHPASSFLKWFIDEQVEEESTASDIVSKLKFAGESGGALLMLDRELGARVFVNPLNKDEN